MSTTPSGLFWRQRTAAARAAAYDANSAVFKMDLALLEAESSRQLARHWFRLCSAEFRHANDAASAADAALEALQHERNNLYAAAKRAVQDWTDARAAEMDASRGGE